MTTTAQLRDSVRTLSLPTSRHVQLSQLAEKRGLSIADCIGEFINEAIQRGELDDRTPGITISATPEGTILLATDDDDGAQRLIILHVSTAETAADLIGKTATAPRRGMRVLNFDSPANDWIHVTRRGPAVVLGFPNEHFEIVVSGSVAADVKRQLEKAIAQAKGTAAA